MASVIQVLQKTKMRREYEELLHRSINLSLTLSLSLPFHNAQHRHTRFLNLYLYLPPTSLLCLSIYLECLDLCHTYALVIASFPFFPSSSHAYLSHPQRMLTDDVAFALGPQASVPFNRAAILQECARQQAQVRVLILLSCSSFSYPHSLSHRFICWRC